MKIKVRLKKREVELKEYSSENIKVNIKVKVEVKEQDYVVSRDFEYDGFLDNDVLVKCEYEDGTAKEENWWVDVKKSYFTNVLFLKSAGSSRDVLEKPTIGIVSYRWGVITGWVVGIGLAITGIIGFVKHRKNKK